jgi:hypothetical protein
MSVSDHVYVSLSYAFGRRRNMFTAYRIALAT